MRRPLVAGNWKMNGSVDSTASLAGGIASQSSDIEEVDIVICPSFTLLSMANQALGDSAVMLGAQDLEVEEKGAFTGQISADMLIDQGCDFVIVGHSERRTLYAETDKVVAAKTMTALQKTLVPIICVGETQSERDSEQTEAVINHQLSTVIEHIGADALVKSVVAYEPVWAIGTGLTATPQQAQEVHAFIRNLVEKHSHPVAQDLRILYGGSMKPDNAAELMSQPDIDGGLIGGASLQIDSFMAICQAAEADNS